jgi:hypothetical protein
MKGCGLLAQFELQAFERRLLIKQRRWLNLPVAGVLVAGVMLANNPVLTQTQSEREP